MGLIEGSGRIIEYVDAEFVNVSIFSLLPGSTYIELPRRLRNSMKVLINIKINNNKFFLWCHLIHLNPLKMYPERIKKADANMVNNLDYEGIEFSISKKDFGKTQKKNNIGISLFCYENNLVYPVYVSYQTFEDCIDL